ncbi:MAG: glycosyltransferase family 2 protein [Geminicoccaceae bacterium]|nr:glycosyltransferase family 2 protein [Geminicoccaceae bacterium]
MNTVKTRVRIHEAGSGGAAIAVVIAARNVENFIGATLQSVFDQSCRNFELIVVLDRSTDRSGEIVASFSGDPRLTVVERDCLGVSHARNIGLELVHAPLVVFVDGDDIMAVDALEAFVEACERKPNIVAVVGGHNKIDEQGALIRGEEARDRPGFGTGPALAQLLRRNTIVNGGTIALRTDVVREVGGFDVELTQGEDWELWCRVACRGDFATLGQRPVLDYRQRRSSATASLVRIEIRPDDPAIDKVFAAGSRHSGLTSGELARLHRTASISSFWARARIALYQGQNWSFVKLLALGLWRYPDSLYQGFLLQFLGRKFRSILSADRRPAAGDVPDTANMARR